jgi:exodeoxyribonuclease VII small subunit
MVQPEDAWNYEDAVRKIEAIAAQIESGELALEAVFDRFSTAAEELANCESFLEKKQQQLDVIIEELDG